MPGRVLAVGEVLWDIFAEESPADGAPRPQKSTLGGAPLNFAAHLRRLGHEVLFVSALGNDELGSTARERIAALGLDTAMIAVSRDYETGTARVWVGPGGQTSFTIVRPAAYDDLNLAPAQLAQLSAWNPDYVYFGTLFASTGTGREALHRVLAAVPRARR